MYNTDKELIYIDGIEVTYNNDADNDDAIGDNPEAHRLYIELYQLIQKESPKSVEKGQKAVAKFPDIAIFKNLLAAGYDVVKDIEKQKETLDLCVEQHPKYFVGVLAKCQFSLINEYDTTVVESFFGGEPESPLLFAPHRKRFHVSEMKQFYKTYALYYHLMDVPEKVKRAFDSLHTLGIPKKEAENWNSYILKIGMFRNLKRMQEGINIAKNRSQNGIFKSEHEQKTEAPVLQYTTLWKELERNGLTCSHDY